MEHAGNEQPSFHDEGQLYSPGQATVPASLLPSVLGRLGLGDRAALSLNQADEVVAALKHEASAVRVAAVRALEQGGTSSIEPLVTALHDSAWEVRAAAVWALGKLGEQAPLEALLGALADEDPSVRAAALRALSLLGDRVPLESLVLALHDAEWQVREIAALTLGERGEQAPLEPLVAALHDEHTSVREAARMALGQSHPSVLSTIFTGPGVVPQGQPSNEQEMHSPPWTERSDYLLFLTRFFGSVFGARIYPSQETDDDQEVPGVNGRSYSDRHETSARLGRAAGMQGTRHQAARVKPQHPILRIAERALVALMLVGLLVSWWVIALRLHPSSHGSAMPLLAYHNHAYGSALWSPDGRYLSFLASPTIGGEAVQVWDRATGQLATHVPPTLVAQSVRHLTKFSPNGKYLAILDLDANNMETVQVRDIITWRAIITAHYSSEYVSAQWSPDSTRIVFPTLVRDNGDGAEQVWNVVTGHMLGTCHFPKVGILLPIGIDTDPHLSPDGHKILDVVPGDASIVDLTTCKLSIVPANPGVAIWSPEGNRFATISLAGGKMVQVWDAQTGHNLSTYHLPTPVLHIAWTLDSTRIVADGNAVVYVVDIATGRIVLQVNPTLVDTQPLWALSPDGRRIASLSEGNTVQVWDAVKGSRLKTYQSQGGRVQVITWSPDSQSIATGSRDGTVNVWNGTIISGTYGGNASAIWNIVWSPDGKFIAAGDATGGMQVWQIG